MKSKRKFLSVFAILFALVFALSVCFFAACGNKDEEKDDNTTTEQDENTGSTGGNEGGNEGGDTGSTGGTEGGGTSGGTEGGSGSGETATVTGVTVTPETLDLVMGVTETGTLTASVTMSSGSYEGAYEWTSSDFTVATVSDSTTNTATVTAVKASEEPVTITVSAGEKEATCTVTVSEPEPTETSVTTADELTAALVDGGSIVLGNDITGTFTVSKDTTLDLAGYSITYSGPETYDGYGADYATVYTIVVEEGASLTIVDGSETDAVAGTGSINLDFEVPTTTWNDMRYSPRFAAIQTEGTLIVNGGSIVSTSVGVVAEAGTTSIYGGSIEAPQYSIFEGAGSDVVVNICGGTVSGGRGVCVDGDAYFGYEYIAQSGSTSRTQVWQDDAKTTLNVYEGATVVSEGRSAISTLGYANADSTYVNIYGGTIMGEDLSTLGEEDSSLSSTSDFGTVYIANGNLRVSGEPEITGTYALSIKGGSSVISGGTFTSTGMGDGNFSDKETKPASYALSVVYYGPQPQGSVTERDNVENTLDVAVSGGTFTGALVYDPSLATTKKTASFSITGGTFSEDPSAYVQTGYEAVLDETTGNYVVGEAAANLTEIASIDFTDTTKYSTNSDNGATKCIDDTAITAETNGATSYTSTSNGVESTHYSLAVNVYDINGNETGFKCMQSDEKQTKLDTQNKIQCVNFGGAADTNKSSLVYYLDAGTYTITLKYFGPKSTINEETGEVTEDKSGRYGTVLDSTGSELVSTVADGEKTGTGQDIMTRTITFELTSAQNIFIGSKTSGLYLTFVGIYA